MLAKGSRPPQQPTISAQRGINLHRREHRVALWRYRAGGMRALVRIDSDNDHAVVRSSDDTSEEAVDDTPTSSSGRRSILR
jgi:hypothetical protein